MTLIRRLILAAVLMAGIAPAIAQVPPPVPALPDTERRTTYSISASTCACSVGFQLYGDSTDTGNWLTVWINGLQVPSTDWTITSATGSIATIPRPITNAVLTFTTPRTGTVQIVGARRPRRSSQFVTQPSARDFNQVLSDMEAQSRELWDRQARTLQGVPGDNFATFPTPTVRASTILGFDGSGNLAFLPLGPTISATAGSTYNTRGLAAAATISGTVQFIQTAGYAAVGDNGAAMYIRTGGLVTCGFQSADGAFWALATAVVRPEMCGATCTNTGDDGPAIQRAIDSTAGHVTVQLSPTCVYRVVTGISWKKEGVYIRGAGQYVSTISYEPGADGTLFQVGDGSLRLYHSQLTDFTVVSPDITHTKIAFKATDISESRFANLRCIRTISTGGTWAGGTGSICLSTNGRDTTTFEGMVLYAEQPIVLNINPNIFIASDHFVFRDLDIVGSGGFPCITAADGVVISNTTFEGRQTWNICTYGFFVNDSTSTQNWNNLSFSNVRSEQTSGATGFTFYIVINTGNRLIGLTIRNSQLDPGMKGILLRNVQNATIDTVDFSCSIAVNALDLNTTNDAVRFINAHFESPCTSVPSSGSPMVLQWAASFPSTASLTLPSDAIYGKQQVAPPMFGNALGVPKIAATGVAPGAGLGRLEFVAGTGVGTCKLIAYAGTSGAATTILDNIGGGC